MGRPCLLARARAGGAERGLGVDRMGRRHHLVVGSPTGRLPGHGTKKAHSPSGSSVLAIPAPTGTSPFFSPFFSCPCPSSSKGAVHPGGAALWQVPEARYCKIYRQALDPPGKGSGKHIHAW